MIKLIVSDLDGTLLHDDKDYNHERFARMIPELEKRGIVFAPASGRSYPTLRSTFEPVSYTHLERILWRAILPTNSGSSMMLC